MAMLAKRRAVDFSTIEMAKLSKCDNDKTLNNCINRICERYNIDKGYFRLEGIASDSRKEVFYPAECAELLALLIRCEEKNPAKRKNSNKDRVTMTNIRDYYAMLLDETETLPEPFRRLIYCLPSHLVNQKIVLWSDVFVKKLALFSDVYVSEAGEDLGALLKYLSIRIDESTYTMFSTQRFKERIGEYNRRHIYGSDYARMLDWINVGAAPIEVLNPFDMETASNIGLDVGIAKLIELIMEDIEDQKEDIQFQKPKEITDIEEHRKQYYEQYIGELVRLNRNYENNAYCVQSIKDNAERYKMYSERARDSEITCKEELKQHYLKEISEKELEIAGLKTRIMLLENVDEDDTLAKTIQEQFVEKCKKVDDSETLNVTNKFVGNLLWNFLHEKK